MSRTRTRDPLGRARTITAPNSSGVLSRPLVVTGKVSRVARRARPPSQPARRIGGALLSNRRGDVLDRDAQLGHLVGIERKQHGEVEPTEHEGAAYSGQPLELILAVE